MSPEATSMPDEEESLAGDGRRGPEVAVARPDLGRVTIGCVLAWAFPGAGHVALGRVARGALFAAVILGLFLGGLALDGKVYRPVVGQPLSYLAALGGVGVGLPYVVVHWLELGEGDLGSSGYEYGTTFTLIAGLLNLLVVLDAYDVAAGRR